MSNERFNKLIDLYAPRISRTAMVFLKDKRMVDDVTFHTFSTISDFDVTNEDIIFQIASCEIQNEFYNMAVNYKPKRKRMRLSLKLLSVLGGAFIAAVLITCLACFLVSLLMDSL